MSTQRQNQRDSETPWQPIDEEALMDEFLDEWIPKFRNSMEALWIFLHVILLICSLILVPLSIAALDRTIIQVIASVILVIAIAEIYLRALIEQSLEKRFKCDLERCFNTGYINKIYDPFFLWEWSNRKSARAVTFRNV
jgi:hypothetical protein